MSRIWRLERAQLIKRPLEEVFAFFADAANLQAITPPSLNFTIQTPQPIEMKTGTQMEYRLQLFSIPFRWKTNIDLFEPPFRFVDRQVSGPYKLWRHLHEFHETADGVLMVDQIDYQIGWWLAGRMAHAMMVRSTLENIFDYRRRRVAELLPDQTSKAVT